MTVICDVQPTHEYHVHLYGCPSADLLWNLAVAHRPDEQRLKWYGSEFERLTGRPSLVHEFWQSQDGLQLLRDEYQVASPCTFNRFQAAINLAIACFPLAKVTPSPLFAAVMAASKAEGLRYVEYRVFLPPYFSDTEQQQYLTTLAEQTIAHTDAQFTPRLAISIVRDPHLCVQLYRTLKQWQKLHPDLATQVAAIDFCGDECGFPPRDKRAFCEQLQRDNDANPANALALLYHVGETIALQPAQLSLQWIWQAAELGAQRLGHASILGIAPTILQQQAPFREWGAEAMQAYDDWLAEHQQRLAFFGFDTARSDRESLAYISDLQRAVAGYVKDRGCVIESCPTSNYVLSGVQQFADIPLRGLINYGLQVVICADDPGIFASPLTNEYRKAAAIGVSTTVLQEISLHRC